MQIFLDSERFVCLLNVPGLLKNFTQEFWSWNLFKELFHSDILYFIPLKSITLHGSEDEIIFTTRVDRATFFLDYNINLTRGYLIVCVPH